jgi:phospholipid/cholesterol/gamma-HCH transport system ATP-binding protein
MSALIRVESLYKSFFGTPVLNGVSFEVNKGETVVIMGESGTGKSVLLKHMIGLLDSDAGSIFVKDKLVSNLTEREWMIQRRNMSYVFQGSALFDSISIFDNVAFPLRQRGKPEKLIKKTVTDRLHHVGLSHVANEYPASLSGGMQKRVSVARALVMNPEIVLYDEPTTGLDPVMTTQISDLIVKMKEGYGVTSVVVSHDIKSALSIADVLVILFEGKVYAQGGVDVIKNSKDPLVRQFLEGRAKGPIDPLRARSVKNARN